MDNAAGVAAMLDIAAHLKETGAKTKRSILLVAVTGEEKGLLGSKVFRRASNCSGKEYRGWISTSMNFCRCFR